MRTRVLLLLQQWLYGFALPRGLETFAALQALSENASCKFTPAVRTVSLVFNRSPENPYQKFKSQRTPAALCSAQSTALGFAWRPYAAGEGRGTGKDQTPHETAKRPPRRAANWNPLSGEHLRRTICIGNEARSENARSLRLGRTQIVSQSVPRAPNPPRATATQLKARRIAPTDAAPATQLSV
jgi:hypothetical protein